MRWRSAESSLARFSCSSRQVLRSRSSSPWKMARSRSMPSLSAFSRSVEHPFLPFALLGEHGFAARQFLPERLFFLFQRLGVALVEGRLPFAVLHLEMGRQLPFHVFAALGQLFFLLLIVPFEAGALGFQILAGALEILLGRRALRRQGLLQAVEGLFFLPGRFGGQARFLIQEFLAGRFHRRLQLGFQGRVMLFHERLLVLLLAPQAIGLRIHLRAELFALFFQ